MAGRRIKLPAPQAPSRAMLTSAEFASWSDALDPERRAAIHATLRRIVAAGPTQGRPLVDVVHRSRLHKLKEARIDRSTRVLFAFDSNQDAIMLVGGDKRGKWNRWYPSNIELAENLYLKHERSIGREPLCLSQRAAGRTSSPRTR
jgi:hypothetical protein